jgi:hypothetical protein
MFQGCTVNRQNLAFFEQVMSRLLWVRIGRTRDVSGGLLHSRRRDKGSLNSG